jgi:hypothetical protein
MTTPPARTFEEIAREALGEKTLLPLRCYEIVLACVSTALREAEERGRREAIEECAKAADKFASVGSCAHEVYGKAVAKEIRALGEKEKRG